MAATLTTVPYTPNLTFGGDPEFFLVDGEGAAIPAEHALPAQEEVSGEETAYRDGYQVELGLRPSTCRAWVIDSMTRAGRNAYRAAKEKGYDLSAEAAVDIDLEKLAETRDPRSSQFGCEPDLLAHEGARPNIVELSAETHPVRYAGGHLHFGAPSELHADVEWTRNWALLHPIGQIEFVKMLDTVLGTVLVLLERESDRKRREVYGLAGTFRTTRYGLEYRMPSNLIYRHPALLNLAFSLSRIAAAAVSSGEETSRHFMVPSEDVVGAINEGDREQAYRNFMAIKENVYAVGNVIREDLSQSGLAALEYMMRVGVENVITQSFVDAWHLSSDVPPYHGNLGPTWREAHSDLLQPFGKDWFDFLAAYRPDQSYL